MDIKLIIFTKIALTALHKFKIVNFAINNQLMDNFFLSTLFFQNNWFFRAKFIANSAKQILFYQRANSAVLSCCRVNYCPFVLLML